MSGLQLPKIYKRRISWWFVIYAVLILAAGGMAWVVYHPELLQAPSIQPVALKQAVRPVGLQSHLLFAGDVYWGRYVNQWSQASGLKPPESYPFSRLNEFKRSDYDAWIANMECPSVSAAHPTAEAENVTLTFNCPPSYIPEAAKWFTVFSNANNHSDNQGGQAGLDETRQHLNDAGIQYFGHYDPAQTTKLCEVIALPVRVNMSDNSQKAAKLPVAMCGYNGVFKVPQPASLAVMQDYAKYMPVIAYPHMGVEYQPAADQLRQNLYHKMIDNGADMVLGNHPHWVQQSEAYNGHPIFYSMGNFIFDQQEKPETTRSAAIDVTLNLAANAVSSDTLAAWTKLGESCGTFEDDCLAQAKTQNLQRLPLTFALKIVGVDISSKITHPADAATTQAIKDRLDWASTIQGLQPPFSGQ